MTSTPVKDVNSLMNFVGGKPVVKAGSATQAGSFGDVMSRTQNNATDSKSQAMTGRQTGKPQAMDSAKKSQETLRPEAKTEKPADAEKSADAEKPSDAVKTEEVAERVTPEQSEALEEAGNEIIKEIAGEFELSEEEVKAAMEILGLSIYSLFEPSNLKQLVLQLEGGQDVSALLTDEKLFTNLQNVLGMVSDVKTELTGKLELTPEELQALSEQPQKDFVQIEDAKEIGNEVLKVDEGSVIQTAEKEEIQITVEVKSGDETIRLAADEKGNVTETVEVVSSETEEKVTPEHAMKHEQKGNENSKEKSEDTMNMGQVQMDASLQNKVEAPQVSFEQTTEVFNQQTREIMDQIMDYMKVQLKPGMEQLEMQLHPESLGTVHIQLSTKGGEVTAQFQVQNETVKAVIEGQIVTLQESLKEQGVKVEAVQVTVENHGFESNLWQGQGREENASSGQNKKSSRRINLNDLDGLFEEEASEEEILAAKIMEANGNTIDYTA